MRVEGQVTLNSTLHVVLALQGLGIAFLPEDEFAPYIEEGRPVWVLEDWCAPFEGYYLLLPQPATAVSGVLVGG